MNNLSWFIYLADVLPNIQAFFTVIGVVAGFLLSIVLAASYNDAYRASYGEGVWDDPSLNVLHRKGCTILKWVVVPMLLISPVIPSTQTLYLIAGSEAGEMVVTSEQGQEIISDIHDVVKQQLNNLKSSK